MDYPFENLTPEKFQQFCQALLTMEFPDVICLPVAQPDGGRDAIVPYEESGRNKFLVFQVKFVRKPLAQEDPHKWLVEILEEEAPKIKELLPRGASKYYLLTNIPGTAHIDVGSIDKVAEILKNELPLPAECWWRDDLARRLDTAAAIKWSYPELLSGIDVLKQLVESGLNEHKERRARAVRLFLRDQYQTEKEVRFKQIELQNRLLDLFIDVPIALRDVGNFRTRHYFFRNILNTIGSDYEMEDSDIGDDRIYHEPDRNAGAASFFLHRLTQRWLQAVVLEGAPGQGKSTITQYICQVHRMRLLNETADLENIAEQHRSSPIRLPMRIDLRDLATWFNKRSPFSADETEIASPYWSKNLDSFLAAFISHHSGGEEFSVSDLHAVISLSAILLVFDGLDEVADINRRQEIVDEISKGIYRLREIAASIQVIITSRPAAFANSPGFANKDFPHFQLESLTRPLILEYAERWLRARRLQGPESSEVRNILKEKLDQPHLRDLAKNPMQLAILLSLIHNRGSSLPDKRTELYDSYIDLFFSREAQKSSVVREHRDLLINIHRYLAWVLQFETEEGKHRGSIAAERLEKLLFDYLSREAYDTSLVNTLFSGVVERVVALVSRVEGTYEFEVQPLREYFAARYLYVTAPYSPPGSPKRGNKLDRFDAISRNFYWLNVTRFYAGCFDIGELPSLADRLEDLTKEDGYRQTNHPHYLAATLLTDWVFAQHPKSLRKVVSLMIDGLGLRLLLAPNRRSVRSVRLAESEFQLALPKQCGRDELLAKCFQILRTYPSPDYADSAISLIKLNAEIPEISDTWLCEALKVTGTNRSSWLNYGLNLGVLAQQPLTTLGKLMEDSPSESWRLRLIYRARRIEFLEQSEERINLLVRAVLDRQILPSGVRKLDCILDCFAEGLNVHRYADSFQTRQPFALNDLWQSSKRFVNLSLDVPSKQVYDIYEKCKQIVIVAIREAARPSLEWASDVTPWSNLVEEVRKMFGDQWICLYFANISAGIRSNKQTCAEDADLLDESRELCRRARYARLRAGQPKWWERQFETAKNEMDLALICLILITWAKPNTLLYLTPKINDSLKKLSVPTWKKLAELARAVPFALRSSQERYAFRVNDLTSDLSPRTVVALGTRAKSETEKALYERYLLDYSGDDTLVWRMCFDVVVSKLREDPNNWASYLSTIANYGNRPGLVWPSHIDRSRGWDNLPVDAARKIAECPEEYPGWLVNLSQAVCRKDIASRIIPVGTIARENEWF